MAELTRDKSGNYLIRFRWEGTRPQRSIGTKDQADANRIKATVEWTLRDIKHGRIEVPHGVDIGDFLISGGKVQSLPDQEAVAERTVQEVFDAYTEHNRHKEVTTRGTLRTHFKHFTRHVSDALPFKAVTLAVVKDYAAKRSGEVWGGKPIGAQTIRKELETIRAVQRWASESLAISAPLWNMKQVPLPRTEDREQFRTMDEIRVIIARNGITATETARLWECLYLTGEQIASLLDFIQAERSPVAYAMISFVAMTGARRSEMMRSRIDDFDFATGKVFLREKKRKQGRETTRTVDLHPRLADVMRSWFSAHPGGQFTLCHPDARPFAAKEMRTVFRAMVKGTEWEVVPGFHTFRHSFASILASKGVDQRIIDAFLGHQTEDMQRRYRHLFPATMKSAIAQLLPT